MANCHFRLVEKERLPPEKISYHYPHLWTEQIIRIIGDWIRIHQLLLDRGDEAALRTSFQWCEYEGHTDFRTTLHPQSTLTYSQEASVYSVAMECEKFPLDTYILISLESDGSLFGEEARSLIATASHLDSTAVSLIPLFESYYRSDPPLVSV